MPGSKYSGGSKFLNEKAYFRKQFKDFYNVLSDTRRLFNMMDLKHYTGVTIIGLPDKHKTISAITKALEDGKYGEMNKLIKAHFIPVGVDSPAKFKSMKLATRGDILLEVKSADAKTVTLKNGAVLKMSTDEFGIDPESGRRPTSVVFWTLTKGDMPTTGTKFVMPRTDDIKKAEKKVGGAHKNNPATVREGMLRRLVSVHTNNKDLFTGHLRLLVSFLNYLSTTNVKVYDKVRPMLRSCTYGSFLSIFQPYYTESNLRPYIVSNEVLNQWGGAIVLKGLPETNYQFHMLNNAKARNETYDQILKKTAAIKKSILESGEIYVGNVRPTLLVGYKTAFSGLTDMVVDEMAENLLYADIIEFTCQMFRFESIFTVKNRNYIMEEASEYMVKLFNKKDINIDIDMYENFWKMFVRSPQFLNPVFLKKGKVLGGSTDREYDLQLEEVILKSAALINARRNNKQQLQPVV